MRRRPVTLETALERLLFSVRRVRIGGDDCWDFGTPGKYGRFAIERGRVIPAHRASWMLHRGQIPTNLFVLHKCDRPSCVNPDHLFVGTHGDNIRDMYAKGRGGNKHATVNALESMFAEPMGDGVMAHVRKPLETIVLPMVRIPQKLWRDVEALAAISKNAPPRAVLCWLAARGLRAHARAGRGARRG